MDGARGASHDTLAVLFDAGGSTSRVRASGPHKPARCIHSNWLPSSRPWALPPLRGPNGTDHLPRSDRDTSIRPPRGSKCGPSVCRADVALAEESSSQLRPPSVLAPPGGFSAWPSPIEIVATPTIENVGAGTAADARAGTRMKPPGNAYNDASNATNIRISRAPSRPS